MFLLRDMRTGQARGVAGDRPRRLSIVLAEPAAADPVGLDDLRASLVADLIRRVAESRQSRVSAWQRLPEGAAGLGQSLRAVWDGLNIYPLEFAEQPPGPVDVSVIPARGDAAALPDPAALPNPAALPSPAPGPGALLVLVADAAGAAFAPADLLARGLDPLGLRFAFLAGHYRQRLPVAWETLREADRALRVLRTRVADWATSPSQPMSAEYLRGALAAFDDDLDTPAALAALEGLSTDAAIAPGSKFETVAYLDRLLGLDLAREVGR